jgi:hypothetical protein
MMIERDRPILNLFTAPFCAKLLLYKCFTR